MSEGYIEVSEAKGKNLRTIEKTIDSVVVHEEVIQIGAGYGTIRAAINEDGYLKVESHSNHEADLISFGQENISAGTIGFILVDLSDTINYPHSGTTYIGLNWLIIQGLADSTAEGDWTIGYISSIGASGAVFNGMLHGHFDKKEEKFDVEFNFHPLTAGCSTIHHLSGPVFKSIGDTIFQNDVPLLGTAGSVAPDVGDIVAKLEINVGSVTGFAISLAYHAH